MAIQRINLGTAPSGTGGDTNRTAFKKIDDNFADTTNAASRQVGTDAGNVMEVGAFGFGGNAASLGNVTAAQLKSTLNKTKIVRIESIDLPNIPFYSPALYASGTDTHWILAASAIDGNIGLMYWTNTTEPKSVKILSSVNTQVDPNGFIKNASPIVSLYADKIELNDEAAQQKITFEKLGVGDYLVKGSTGFAQEGWYIEMPKDANGNVLVAVIYEQLDNNDISVKTYAKKFDEETGDVVANTAKPRDIPSTRWIDLRLQSLPQPTQPLSKDQTDATNAE